MKTAGKYICLLLAAVLALNLGGSAEALGSKYSMSYIYYGNADYFAQSVNDTGGSLDEVAPDYFALDSSGALVLSPDYSADFVAKMHDAGVKVVPYLTNDWDRAKGIAALVNREALSTELADAISSYGLDGVNVDIENVTPSEREAYVDFVRLLRSKLGENKVIAVAVAANPYGTTSGWAGSYDYAGLAEYSDYLMVMAYDESYYGSAPGPVASIGNVEKAVKYALSVAPKDKIVLGLPFYGRIWSSSGGSPYGYGISASRIETLLRDYNGSVTFDNISKAACATISVGASDTKPVVGGKSLSPGTYKIWYSDERSIKAELELITKYDLKGAGSWSLGQESDATWNYYSLWLNGCTFSDVQTSWAKDYILTAYLNGWMNGESSELFAPDAQMTRAQAAAILVRMLGLSPAVSEKYGFDDCKGSWAEAYIDTAREYNVVTGVGGNLFSPDAPVTREQIAVMLNNVLKYQSAAAESAFSDVTSEQNAWSYEAVAALSSKGVITGYTDGSFRPAYNVTRAEMTAMISRIDISSFKIS